MNALRKIKRQVAKNRMQKAGIRHLCRQDAKNRMQKAGIRHLCRQDAKGHKQHNSYFSRHWREAIRKDGRK